MFSLLIDPEWYTVVVSNAWLSFFLSKHLKWQNTSSPSIRNYKIIVCNQTFQINLKLLTHMVSFNQTTSWNNYYYCPHFRDRKTEPQGSVELLTGFLRNLMILFSNLHEENCTQYLVIIYKGKNLKKRYICVCIHMYAYMIHICLSLCCTPENNTL